MDSEKRRVRCITGTSSPASWSTWDDSPGVHHPVDFVIERNGTRETVKLVDLRNTGGLIKDIGEETMESYAESLQERPFRVRVGPPGVYEENFMNGLELTKEDQRGWTRVPRRRYLPGTKRGLLLGHVEESVGTVCVSGGSFLHGWAGGRSLRSSFW